MVTTPPSRCLFCDRPPLPAPLPLRNDNAYAGDGNGLHFLCPEHTAALAVAGFAGWVDRRGVRWWLAR